MSVSLRKHRTNTDYTTVVVPLQLMETNNPLEPVPVVTIQLLVRLFSSIIDMEQQRFNLTSLPRGIVILDYCYETHAVTIRYSGNVYKITINNNRPVVEIAQ